MKLPLLLIILLTSIITVFSQEKLEFLQVPKEIQKNSKELSHYLVKDASSDSAKAAQLYQWITHNISYDYAVIESGKQLEYMSGTKVLKGRKAVCQGYSALFVELLKNEGIQAATVEGYTSDFLSDSLFSLVGSDHEWVIFKVDNNWYQCDPTWDAGYIGRVSKYKTDLVKIEKLLKKREGKLEKAEKEKKKSRLTKRFEGQDLKELKKKENLSGKYKSSVGFVRYPRLDYFMMSSDTFVQTHLASIPDLQLRVYPITMVDFIKKTKTWDTILARKQGKPLDYPVFVNEYAGFPLNKQWMQRANEGFKFNELSYLTKIVHFNNFIGIHLSEAYREKVEVVSKSDLNAQMFQLQMLNDSVLTFVKPARTVTKDAFKHSKNLMNGFSKEYKTTDKLANSTFLKVISAQEKCIDKLKNTDDEVKKNLEYLREKEVKLTTENRNIKTDQAYDEKSVPASFLPWVDSLFALQLKIDSLRSNWSSLMHSDELFVEQNNAIKNAVITSYYNEYLLNVSTAFYNDTVVHNDTLLALQADYLLGFYKNSMNDLYYPVEILKEYKNFERLLKNGSTRLRKYGTVNTSYNSSKFTDYIVGANYMLIKAIVQDNYQYKNDGRNLIQQEKIYADYYKDLHDDLEEEKKLKVKNIEYSADLLEKDKKRTFEMIKEIEEGAKKLDAFFIKRLAI